MPCNAKESSGEICGRPSYSNASDLCRDHYEDRYPDSFNRLESEGRAIHRTVAGSEEEGEDKDRGWRP